MDKELKQDLLNIFSELVESEYIEIVVLHPDFPNKLWSAALKKEDFEKEGKWSISCSNLLVMMLESMKEAQSG